MCLTPPVCVCVCCPERQSWADSCFCRQAWQTEALLFIVMLDGGTYQPLKEGRKEKRSVCVLTQICVCVCVCECELGGEKKINVL